MCVYAAGFFGRDESRVIFLYRWSFNQALAFKSEISRFVLNFEKSLEFGPVLPGLKLAGNLILIPQFFEMRQQKNDYENIDLAYPKNHKPLKDPKNIILKIQEKGKCPRLHPLGRPRV